MVKSIQVEGDDAHGVDVQYPWEPHPQREHNHTLPVGPFYIDTHPVTNARYAQYLNATGYTPIDPLNWLKQWNGSATPPAGTRDRPVTFVSLNEARLFCSWAGGRLPHSYEWQYAAQGNDGRLYPWGNTQEHARCSPDFPLWQARARTRRRVGKHFARAILHLGSQTWLVTCGSTRMSSGTSIHVLLSYVEVPTIAPRDPIGTFRTNRNWTQATSIFF